MFSLKQKSKDENGEPEMLEVTVYDYFVNYRKIELRYSGDLPCINVGRPKRPTYFPLELCSLVSLQRYTKALSTLQRSSLVEKSRQKPQERMRVLSDALKLNNYDAEPLLKSCGISINSSFTQVEGRILPAPRLKVGNGEDFFPRNGRWNFNNKKLVDPTKIEKWAVVNFSARCDIRNLVKDLIKCGGLKGIKIDDIIFGATDESLCDEFSSLMQKEYEMSMMGELTFFLGLQVKQCPEGILINQTKYIKDLLKKFQLDTCSTMKTPMAPPLKLDSDPDGVSVNITHYRGMIGSLLYLTASRPDIMFATCLCARYQANPKESHLAAVKRIFRYLKGTMNLGLWYPKDSGFELIGYSDSDFAGSKIDRKSTTGSCQLLGGKLVSWSSKKQHSVSTSTAEAEYVAAGSCCAQILWMKNQLQDYDQMFSKIPILCDNSSAIAIANNPVLHSRSKHIDIRYHFIRDHVSKGDVELHFIPTDYQLADLFTKPLDEARFKFLIGELGMINIE